MLAGYSVGYIRIDVVGLVVSYIIILAVAKEYQKFYFLII